MYRGQSYPFRSLKYWFLRSFIKFWEKDNTQCAGKILKPKGPTPERLFFMAYEGTSLRSLFQKKCVELVLNRGGGDLYCLNTFNRKCLLPMGILNWNFKFLKLQVAGVDYKTPTFKKKEPITYREFEPKNQKFKESSDYRLGISTLIWISPI